MGKPGWAHKKAPLGGTIKITLFNPNKFLGKGKKVPQVTKPQLFSPPQEFGKL